MRKPSIYTLIVISLLLLAVSCQAETVEPAATAQGETPVVTTIQRPARDQPSSSGLRAWLEAPASLAAGEPVKVQFSLMNETESDLYLLNWFTPLEGLGGEIFRVTRDGQRIRYQGPLASRGDPTPEAYTLVAAGGMAQVEVDLTLAYDFSRPGTYTIEFISPSLCHVARLAEEMAQSMGELGPVDIPSNTITVAIGA